MRLINTQYSAASDSTARTYYSAELSEYTVKFYTSKQHRPTMDYFTDDKNDAIGTASQVLFDLSVGE